MANGEPDKAERDFFNRRIAIAREFKRQTCGDGEITCALYGETEADHLNYRPAKTMTKAERETKRSQLVAARKRAEFAHKLARTRRFQAKTGGLYGITIVPHTERTRKRWRAHISRAAVAYDCAIDAANARNEAMQKRHPGYPEFLVDIDAVWDKWGCECGRHKRQGKKR